MKPRILLISQDEIEKDKLTRIFDQKNLFIYSEKITEINVQQIIQDQRVNVILLSEQCLSILKVISSLSYKPPTIVLVARRNDEVIRKTA
ncbi:hypothetical protein CR194_04500 [Salipaludibacillus keqinensis]|uniref:Uncharacterized protein n=1 Tax=Salipaludibacillus keqinensis TaxID=2045207 RepID=A0A323TLH1_9BACI|nr:hypothetical protein [Salipaludibacillus keqinensis]PYZ94794.1 hypothetical protein CR194_04500 [Salipaludibacillus keqinensis]